MKAIDLIKACVHGTKISLIDCESHESVEYFWVGDEGSTEEWIQNTSREVFQFVPYDKELVIDVTNGKRFYR